jgi:hypothetical protein
MVVLAVIAVVVAALIVWRVVRKRRRLTYIERYEFPRPLGDKLCERHPELTSLQTDRALEALRQWFVACHFADGRMIAMPSRVADDAWHEFILMTRLYHTFCNASFGRYLHHTPDAVSETPIRPALPKTLDVLERNGRNGSLAGLGTLPLLFTVDEELRVENGRSWTRELIAGQEQNDAAGCLGGGSHVATANGGCGGCGGDGCGGCGGCGSCA